MSASLVGSEMCIRDRCTCTRARACAHTPWASVPKDLAAAKREAEEAKACLLYTSDAADDM
eukprot:13113244-Alexandrium_andersonii.AAC.1